MLPVQPIPGIINDTAINNSNTSTLVVSDSGSYAVVVRDVSGLTGSSSNVAVTVLSKPTVSAVAGGTTTFCEGSSVTLTASGSGTSYQWKKNGNTETDSTKATYVARTSGTYTVTTTGSNGCSNTSTTITVTANPLPTATATAASATTFCSGNSVTINANTGTGLTYQWLKDGSAITNATNAGYTATATGSYVVRVTNSNSCTASSSSVTVTVNALPATPVITRSNDTLFSNAASGNQWYVNASSISGATNTKYKVTAGGSYYATVTDANGCTSANSNTIVVVLTAVDNTPATTSQTWSIYPNPVVGSQLNLKTLAAIHHHFH